MRNYLLVLFIIQCLPVIICFTKPEPTCKSGDIKCFVQVGTELFRIAISGDDKYGVEPLDPLKHKLIEGKLPSVKYTLRDSSGVGFKNMVLNEIKFVPPNTIHFEIMIPFYELTGTYEVEGKLLNFAIEGKGKFFANTTKVRLVVDATREIYEKDGKKYIKVTEIKTKPELVGTMHMDLENLFNGNKQLSETVLKFINENPKLVADLWQDPLSSANMKKLFQNTNKIAAQIPLEEFLDLGS